MPSFPNSIWSPTTKNNGDVIQPAHVNDAQAEIVAIETGALTATSWTPSLKFGGASVGMTYSAQAGTYVRIGKLVQCYFTITLTAKGSSTGAATMTGLPITAANFPLGMIDYASGTAPGVGTPFVSVNGATLDLLQYSGGSRLALTDTNFVGTDTIRGSIVFTT